MGGCWCPWFLRNVSVLLLSSILYLNLSFAYLLNNCTIPFSENRHSLADINVDCCQRKLAVVPDGIPRGVTWLRLSDNHIQTIYENDFRYLSNLTVLGIPSNKIAHIEDRSFIDLVVLKKLDMSFNQLTKLSNHLFEGLWKLTLLDLRNNQIIFVHPSAFVSMPSLHTVILEDNLLTEMTDIQPILQLPHIEYVNIGSNRFSSFETKHLPLNMSSSLRSLKLSRDGLTIFSITTPVFPHLEEISLDGMNPVYMDIPEFRFFRNVTHFYCNFNCISFKGTIKLLESMVSLVHLQLYYTEKWINRGLLKTVCSIPSLRSLDLRYNSVVHIDQKLTNCSQITKLSLPFNYISNLSSHSIQSMKRLSFLDLAENKLSNVPDVLNSISSLEILNLYSNKITELGCLDFFNLTRLTTLNLENNYIDKVDGCVFQNQKDLKVLKLNNNMLLELGNAFKIGLKRLEFLDLSTNRIRHFGTGDFKSLESLSHLELDGIDDVHNKVFEGLHNLTSLSLSLPVQLDNILSGLQWLRNLTVYLDVPEGYKGVDPNYYQNLMNLSSLRNLNIICRGIHCSMPFHVPIHFLKIMKNLEHFTVNNFHLTEVDTDTFISTPQLKSLTITESGLSDLNPELFQPISKLKVLDLSMNNLNNLDFLAQVNLTSLRYLILNENKLTVINDNIFHFLPALTYLDLSDNPLICDCSNSGFLLWALSSNQTQVVRADQYVCMYPFSKKGTMFQDINMHSCWMDTSFLCYISTTSLVLLTLLTAFGYHFLHWRLVYAYYRLMALLYDMKERKRNEPYRYDAFISYNVKDEAWVHGEMLPVLEDERGWRLCLHHRDFQPGRSIMENITEAIYGSRKTICVISRHYLESEWCSREIQMARQVVMCPVSSHRLLDEKKDVLILLFLEELPEQQLSPYYRMRKLVRRSTYLSWPQAGRHPGLFWQNVHRALESGDRHDDNTHFLSGPALFDNYKKTMGGCWCPWFLRNVSVLLLSSILYLNPLFAYLLNNCTIPFSENRHSLADINVYCWQRKLAVVPDGIPRAVTWLRLSVNQIQTIYKNDFRYLSNLTVLDISFNEIAHIEDRSFINLVELRKLYMSNNQLTKLSNHLFEGLWKLTLLDLSTNQIIFVHPSAFGSMPSLQTVILEDNLLTEMTDIQPILQLPHIEYVNIGRNRFSSFETKHLPLNMSSSLRSLKLSTDGLTIFSITTPVFPHLEEISLDGMNPVDMDIPEFRFFRNVTHFYCNFHCISFKGTIKLLESMVSLVHLKLLHTEKWINRGLLKTVCSIPSLRSLDLMYNSLVHIDQKLTNCSQITKLSLPSNYISNLSRHSIQSMKRLSFLDLADNKLSNVPDVLNSLSSLEILNLYSNKITELGCLDFFTLTRLTTLNLENNYIDKVDGCVFQNQKDLKVLKLNNNLLLELGNAFKIGLKKLEFLDLSTNRIRHFGTGDFKSLESLSHLELDGIGDVHNKVFEGLYNLTSLSLSLPVQMGNILSGLQWLRNLTVYLDVPEGHKGVDSNYYQNLMNLSSLRYLNIICRGIHCSMPFHVPIHFLKIMNNLEHFTVNNVHLTEVDTDTFISTPQLKSLTITESGLSDLNPELFQPISKLEVLDLSMNNLNNLDFLAQVNLTSLRCLILNENKLTVINDNIFHFLPALTYLDLSDNPLICDCSNSGFLLWGLSSSQTQIVRADQYVCMYPFSKKGTMFQDINMHSCWMDTSFLCYISTTSLVLLTLLTAFGYHFLHWRLVYAYYRLMALLYDMKERKRNEPYRYDAFISYNVKDEAWVHGEMLPVLEDERGWRLCLHHRDFQPGRSIMENITEAIYGSRKTICVISRHYLESEWCSREIQMASHRLLDEKKDVLILLFLEELPEQQLSPYYRMRKLVRRSTYLSWPQAGRHPGLFWQNVHRALESGDRHDDNTHFLSGPALFDNYKKTMGGCWCPWFLRNVSVLLLSSILYLNPLFAYLLNNCTIPFSENRHSLADINVDCWQRKLAVVPDGIPRGVTWLRLSDNHIQTIYENDFRYLSNLTVLDIPFNKIAHIEDRSFIDLVELRELDMSSNQLTKLSNHLFEGLWKLTLLDLMHNRIIFVHPSAFVSMPSLHTVILEENLLTEMTDIQPILQLPHIEYVNIGSNPFSTFETKDLPLNMSSSLRALKLSTDGLTIFSITTPVFPHLEEMSLDCRNPVDMDIPEFRFFRNVTHFYYEFNCISFKGTIKLLESMVSLVHLKLLHTEKWINRGLLKTVCSIPSLRSLDFRYNTVVHIDQKLTNCSQITKLSLPFNDISNLSSHSIQSMKRLSFLDLAENKLSNVPDVLNSISSLQILNLYSNKITELGCLDFFNLTRLTTLNLENNYIDKVDGCVFQNQKDLKVLKLNNNLLLELGNAFKIGLKKLEFLDLSTNRIRHFGTGDFKSLESLSHLELDGIDDVHNKVFEGLYNLTSLSLSLPVQMDNILSGLQWLRNLTVYLDVPEGYKDVDPNYYRNLMNLSSLRNLNIICRGIHCSMPFHVPIHFLKIMKNLEHFTVNNFHLTEVDTDTFISTPQLKSLTITESGLSDLNPELFQPISKLEVLDLSMNNLNNLDFLAQVNLTSLRCLILNENKLTVINDNIFHFLPALTYLDLSVNPLVCDCSNSGFLLWALSSNQTQVVRADQYVCMYPFSKKGTMFQDINMHSCWMDTSFLCYISTTSLVLLTLLTAFGYHFLHWRLVYAYYRLMALLYDMKERKRNEPYRYDAFISYNVKDEAWVHGEMLPVLEDERGWRLCLHHRDFQPGRLIMENITEAIYGSRKTICVISRHYLESEWCSREIQMARQVVMCPVSSHRLLDEKKDVLILLFLEELPEQQLSPYYRMRKLVRRSTYLSWPQAGRHPGLFWQNVHRALESGDRHDDNTHFLSGPALL
ncbi:Toll-like receptor 13 [Merluccius polli]|uniref:Toll-like receptor 13 n=1 Tax=Merluccius polli TaxID=89951 RepID=A0AA47ME65_MERPO|nr:Toll-like receptor 13 [Merluccius polli]